MIKDSIKSSLCLGKSEIRDIHAINPDLWEVAEKLGLIIWIYKLINDGGLEKDDITFHVLAGYSSDDSQWKISYFWSWTVDNHVHYTANINKELTHECLLKETIEKFKKSVRLDDYKLLDERCDVEIIEDLLIKSGFF